MIGLTAKQTQLLDYLRGYTADFGIAPSIREMGAHLGLNSTGNVRALLDRLEERGAIRRLPYRARGIEVVDADPFAGIPNEALVAELERRGYFASAGKH